MQLLRTREDTGRVPACPLAVSTYHTPWNEQSRKQPTSPLSGRPQRTPQHLLQPQNMHSLAKNVPCRVQSYTS
jgi:hypothetical protein